MPPARQAAHPSRQTWRGAQGAADPQAARRVRRVLWSLAVAALLGCFAWLLIRFSAPAPVVRLVGLAVAGYDVLQAPPLPFALETLDEFQELKRRGLAELTLPADATIPADWDKFFSGLPHRDRGSDRDVLIVYLAAHGVTQCEANGAVEAWLLGGNYNPLSSSKAGMYRLDDLLEALGGCSEQTKLLLLDAGSIEADLALGMAANEFTSLLEQKLAERGDPNLWVLVSNDSLERSHAAYADRRSVFGRFVAGGLAGEADQDADGVDLAELYSYVRGHVASYVWQASAGQETQTPRLLSAGSQGEARSRQRKLTPYRPAPASPPSPAEAAPEKPAPEKPTPDANHAAALRPWSAACSGAFALLQSPEAPTSQPPAANSAPPTPKAESPTPKAESPANDQLDQSAGKNKAPAQPAENAAQPAATQPADSKKSQAPTEQAPAADQGPKAAAPQNQVGPKQPARSPMEQLLFDQWQELARLADRRANSWTPVDYAPHHWLKCVETLTGYELRELRGTNVSPETIQKQLASDLSELERQRGLFEDSTARLRLEQHPDLTAAVHLRNDLCFRLRYLIPWAVDEGDAAANDVEKVLELLAKLMQELRSPPAADADGSESPPVQQWLAELRELRKSLADLVERLDERWRSRLGAALAQNSSGSRNVFAIEGLLDLPWLSAANRAELLDRLRHAAPLTAASGDARDTRFEANSRKRALKRAQLEWRRFQLAGAELTDASSGGSRNDSSATGRASSSQLADLRQWGAQLAQAERLLAETIRLSSSADSQERRRAAEDLLRLADPRHDALDLPSARPYPDFRLAWEPRVTFLAPSPPASAKSADEIELQINATTTIAWQIEASPPAAATVRWSLIYDGSLLEVAPSSGELRLAAGPNKAPLELAVKAKAETGGRAALTLRIDRDDRPPVTERIEVRLPNLPPVELTLGEGAERGFDYDRFDDRRPPQIVLHPRASGRSVFHLQLHNPSGRERKLKYRLLALNRAAAPSDALDAWPLTRDGELAAGFKTLDPGRALTIPPNDSIPFPPPPESPAASATPPAAAPPAAAAAGDKTSAAPIPDGLACEIIDVTTDPRGARQWYWIAVEPMHPQRYLADPIVRYDLVEKRIAIKIQPRDETRLPEEGVKVEWRRDAPIWRKTTPVTIKGVVTREHPELPLYVSVEPVKDLALEVLLDVDGYPRAFCYDIKCDGQYGDVSRKVKNNFALDIVEPREDGAWLRGTPQVALKLRLDVEPGWFDQKGCLLKTSIKAGLAEDEQQTKVFSRDRRFDARLLPVAAAGELAIETSVGDLEATFETGAHPNQDVELLAELTGTNLFAQRELRLDSDPPELHPLSADFKTARGQDLEVRIRASDERSGVDKVEVGIDRNGELKPPDLVLARRSDTEKDAFIATLPTKELPVGRHAALVRAIDRVGNPTNVEKFYFKVLPPGTDPGGPARKTVRLNGRVFANGQVGKYFSVHATGPIDEDRKADAQGAFAFPALPPGEYKLTFKGPINNREVEFTRPLTITAPSEKPLEKTFTGP